MSNFSCESSVVQKLVGVCKIASPRNRMCSDPPPPGIGLKLRLDTLGLFIAMYKQYVDDINISARGVTLGTRCVIGKLILDQKAMYWFPETNVLRRSSNLLALMDVIEWHMSFTPRIFCLKLWYIINQRFRGRAINNHNLQWICGQFGQQV